MSAQWGNLSGNLKAYNQINKRKKVKGKGLGAQPQKRPHHTYLAGS